MRALRQIVFILSKDLLIELRSKEIVTSMLVFALMVVIVFNFIFDPGSREIKAVAPGILWVALIFAGNLGLSRSFAREMDQGKMQGLLLCPFDRSLIYIAKMLGNVLFMLLVALFISPVIFVLFGLSPGASVFPLAFVLLLGAVGLSAVGTLFATISAHTRAREVMLPILLFPVSVPVILAAAKSTVHLLDRGGAAETAAWIRILVAFDLIFVVLCYLLYEHVLEE